MGHVCIVTSAHPWDDVRVASRIAAAFLQAGYDVTWVGPDKAGSSGADAKNPEIRYDLFSSGTSKLDRLRGASKAVKIARGVSAVDWWYTPDPDVAAKLPALAKKRGGQTLFDVHESYHGALLNRWFPGTPPASAREFLRRRISGTCARVDMVIGVSVPVLNLYCAAQPNALVIRNLAPAWFSAEALQRETATTDGRIRFIHGKLSSGNGTLQVAEALKSLPPRVRGKLEIVMLEVESTPASSKEAISRVAADLEPGVLTVIPGIPHEAMAGLMADCAVGLISYQRDLGHESLPNRLFEYMAAGLAILAPSYSPEIVEILDSEEVGVAVDFESPEEIALAIRWCVEHADEVLEMGFRARRAYRERYTWETDANRLIAALAAMESQQATRS